MEEKLYDITPVPVFAWEPGAALWLGILLLVLAVLLVWGLWPMLSRCFSRRKRAFALVEKELEEAIRGKGGLSGAALSRLSLIVRRYLALGLGQELLCMSAQELRLHGQREPGMPESLLQLVSEIENIRYRSSFACADSAFMAELLRLLRSYEQSQEAQGR